MNRHDQVQHELESILVNLIRQWENEVVEFKEAADTEPSITFRNIHEFAHSDGRVIFFEIPAAPRGLPIAWKGHYFARAGESLTHLGLDKSSVALALDQKKRKVANLLTKLRRAGVIRNQGPKKSPEWVIAD
jgi:predicted HTH transcriptional regulator